MDSEIYKCTLELTKHIHENIVKFESFYLTQGGCVFMTEYCNVSRLNK